jgi:Abortive infection alpha
MNSDQLDPLGAKATAEAIKTVVETTTKGVGAFVGKICMPAAEEFGLLLQDKVKSWRAANATKILERAQLKLQDGSGIDNAHAHPRIVGKIIDRGSWVHESNLQDMWAGLFVSSCTTTGNDESNLIFVNLLDQITSLEAKIIELLCKDARIKPNPSRLLVSDVVVNIPLAGLHSVTGIDSVAELDTALDHLHNLGLIGFGSGFPTPGGTPDLVARLSASALGLSLYARAQGFRGEIFDFYEKDNAQESSNPPGTF